MSLGFNFESDMTRFLIAGVVSLILVLLLTWQHHRIKLVTACMDRGGVWNGATSICRPDLGRITIQRDLRRS
jgi:hypothetical protein